MPGPTLLIVEDDRDYLRGLCLRFKAHGFQILTAMDAVQAVLIARKSQPDLILLDLGLPGGDGFFVLGRLATLLRSDAPVVVLSGRDPAENEARALNAGAAAYFQKPADPDLLLATVRRLLSRPLEAPALRPGPYEALAANWS